MKSIKNTDRSRTNKELAKRGNKVKCAKNDGVFRLSMLSPEIIQRAIRGTLPPDISLAKLYKLSSRWDEQLQQLGIAVE